MTKRDPNLPRILARRFDVVCKLMGWDNTGPRWPSAAGKCKVYHYTLEKQGRANRYEINATVNEKGGETVIHAKSSGEETLEWLDGILAAAGHFAPGKVRAAWSASNEVQEGKAK